MHKSPAELHHTHQFHSDNKNAGGKIGIIILINAAVMGLEIIGGTLYGSMAVVADGWHMGTHIFALGITFIAYKLAHHFMHDARFAFGTWKIEILGGYTSAILLGIAGVSMCIASIERFLRPVPIHYDHALIVAFIGFVVNIAGALILGHDTTEPHHHHPDNRTSHHHHSHSSDHASHRDLNMQAAYIHIITDALTSVLAIAALLAAKYFTWNFIDPFAGILGAALILRWTVGLLGATGTILLDREDSSTLSSDIRSLIESDGITRISDLHLWQIAQSKYACIIVVLTTPNGFTIADFKHRLSTIKPLHHITVELHYCSPPPAAAKS